MKNKDKNRYERLFETLELNSRFKLELRNIRRKFEIPLEDGFGDGPFDQKHIMWKKNMADNGFVDFKREASLLSESAIKIIKSFRELPEIDGKNIRYLFYWYVLNGKNSIGQTFKFGSQINFFNIDNLDGSSLDFLKNQFKEGVIIAIPPSAKHSEIINYIDYIFKRGLIFKRDPTSSKRIVKPFRIREFTKSKEHNIILNVWRQYGNKKLEELRVISGDDGAYDKYEAIATILNKEHGMRIKSSGLRTTVSRLKKRKGNP